VRYSCNVQVMLLKTSEELCRVLQFIEHFIEQYNMCEMLPESDGFSDSFYDGYYLLILLLRMYYLSKIMALYCNI